VQDFQESVHTLRCAAKAKRIHSPPNQDPETKRQMLMKMDEEIRTLQFLIADLTRSTTHSTRSTTDSSTEVVRHVKKSPDEAEGFLPTKETEGRSSFNINVLQVSSLWLICFDFDE